MNGTLQWSLQLQEAGQSYEPLRGKGADLRFIVHETLGHACARGRQQLCGSELEKVSEFLKEVWGEMASETGSASLPSVFSRVETLAAGSLT
ncbi:hypothetical protein AK812_SmicGene18677 [Symbiodinium microadriaticum]|uniref:Uncharacterized protein n=1 Tax=Symbiodinium microadriaticum TaxID=2951 RepID=A0A1Q9DUL0_SYMMI|nr:hypothetical protein AK812_SmicGene18677 [Symbiodinium microadriaticum]